MINFSKNKKGFSLIEVVIYVSILVVMAAFVISSVISIYRIFLKTKVERSMNINADVALETLIREIRLATSTTAAGSTFGISPGSLRLNSKSFFLTGAILQMSDSGAAAQDLSGDVRVTRLLFNLVEATSTQSEMVKVEMTLESGAGKYLRTKNFYGSAVLRGKY